MDCFASLAMTGRYLSLCTTDANTFLATTRGSMSFFLVQVIVAGLLLGAVYALFSSGLTLVWGMMNIVNFAHGDFVMLGMYVAFVIFSLFGVGPMLGAPLAILLLATLGIIV